MLQVDMVAFQEFVMQEPLPLATLQTAVLEFLRDRDDVVVFGAQAVNAYVSEPRMAQDIDLLAVRAEEVAHELREYLSNRVGDGRGYRRYQVQKGGNRHLVDLRPVANLPLAQRTGEVLVIAPAELVASKVISYHQRRGKPKAGTDWRDLALLLLAFPELKDETGLVTERLLAAGASPTILQVWRKIVVTDIEPEEDEDEF